MAGKATYFVSDVHLGLKVLDPVERERRFVSFLREAAGDAEAVYLLGDIWDFWYEYKYVVPKGFVRVFAALQDMMDNGVKVYFLTGNHDIWAYHYFEDMGITVLDSQPVFVDIEGKSFCLAHGDGLGPVPASYRFLRGIFRCRFLQALFSTLHPRIAFAIGNAWSAHHRLDRGQYVFKGESEPLYRFALDTLASRKVDCFVFGHYHASADCPLPGDSRLILLDSWLQNSPALKYSSGMFTFLGYSQKSE